jgi:hypothetical protein
VDNEEYTLAHREETLDNDWIGEHPPDRTDLWKNVNELSICPPTQDPLSFEAFGHMAAHPFTALTRPSAPAAVESDSEIERQTPEHNVPSELFHTYARLPDDSSILFGNGCSPASQTEPFVFAYQACAEWWSDFWNDLNQYRFFNGVGNRQDVAADISGNMGWTDQWVYLRRSSTRSSRRNTVLR